MITRLLASLLLLSLSAPSLRSQSPPPEPRLEDDPRGQPTDPRELSDPRDPEIAAYDVLRTEELRGAVQFDLLDKEGKLAELATAIRDQPWELLGWFDGMCESWLALRERDDADDPERLIEAEALRQKMERCALLSDKTVGDTAFVPWVARVMAWDDDQIARYRQAQALYVQGLTAFTDATSANHALSALTPLRQALEQLEPLGLTWESIMSLTLIGRVQLANGQRDSARKTMDEALHLGRSLRDLDAVWNGLSILLDDAIRNADYDGAEKLLVEQYRISLETGDEGSADQVMMRLTELSRYRQVTGR